MHELAQSIVYAATLGLLNLLLIPFLIVYSNYELFTIELGYLRWLGLIPLTVGVVFAGSVVWNFARVGAGTPAPFNPPKNLVRASLFRRVRNPMYLGALLAILGEAIVLESGSMLAYDLIMLSIFQLLLVFYEEPLLKKRFGADYEAYCKATPRWLPRVGNQASRNRLDSS